MEGLVADFAEDGVHHDEKTDGYKDFLSVCLTLKEELCIMGSIYRWGWKHRQISPCPAPVLSQGRSFRG